MSALVGAGGWFLAPSLFRLLRVEGEVLRLAVSYIRTLFFATPFFVLCSTFNGMLMARGNTRPFRDSLIAGFLLNIVFDIWFVFGGLGLAPMGFPGIARATVLLQGLTAAYLWSVAVREGLIPPSGFAHLHPR
ncbi:MATE family efflux transporter, partial [Arthrospira platensis SPKY1]|nr:MATE family efflux transporter [Arthrospira platensis SPKY1]